MSTHPTPAKQSCFHSDSPIMHLVWNYTQTFPPLYFFHLLRCNEMTWFSWDYMNSIQYCWGISTLLTTVLIDKWTFYLLEFVGGFRSRGCSWFGYCWQSNRHTSHSPKGKRGDSVKGRGKVRIVGKYFSLLLLLIKPDVVLFCTFNTDLVSRSSGLPRFPSLPILFIH